MALKPRPPNAEDPTAVTYVSTVTTEELARYAEYADGYGSDEEYEEEVSVQEKQQRKTFADKLSAAKMAVKNFSLPSPEEIKNSTFCKSFQQPLMVKTKFQASQVQMNNQALTKGKTPLELSKISKISDFPLPSFKKHNNNEPEEAVEGESNGVGLSFEGFGYNTLPRSLRETKLITSVTESDADNEELHARMEITKNSTPAQLSEIRSFKDVPIPDKIKHLMDKPVKPMTNGDAPEAKDEEGKKAFSYFPESLRETKLITNVKECTDMGTLRKHQETIKNKTPSELAAITSFSDIPIPSKIENLMKGGGDSSVEFSLENPLKKGELTLPASFKMELAVTSKFEDEETSKKHKEIVDTKSVAELSKISSVADFPVPNTIENLLRKKEKKDTDSETRKRSTMSLSAITSGKILPESLRETKLITNIKVEKDQERLIAHQNLTKNQTPMELGSIKNIHDFPIPERLQRLQHLQLPTFRTAAVPTIGVDAADSPTAPPRQKSCNASIYESLPSSLRNEVIVRSRTITDEESKARQEIIRSKSPVELSQISSLKEIPVPKSIEKFFEKGPDAEEESDYGAILQKYSTLPSSMKTNLLVGVKTEDQEMVKQRSETIKSKSVIELSEIHSVSDIPVPSTLSRLAKRDYAPVERKKLFKLQMKSQSTQSLSVSLHNTLPRSLREKQLLVSSTFEDPDILLSRRSLVESKSVAELSKVTSLSDIPVPGFLCKLTSRSLGKLDLMSNGHLKEPEDSKPAIGIYSTLPKSLNCELLVSKSIQDISIREPRMQLINEKSTKELAQIGSMKDFPIPDVVENIYHKSMERLTRIKSDEPLSLGITMPNVKLPNMLTQPCIVKTKVEDPQVLLERQQIQQQKSIHELSKIRNLNELPIPGNLIHLPDVALPKMKNVLQYIRKPQKTEAPSVVSIPSAPVSPVISEAQYESSVIDEDEYSNMEDSYEVISKEKTESPQIEEEDLFGLATQIKGTPERNTRSKKKRPDSRNRRSQEEKEIEEPSIELIETPPPLPPKRSPHKSMSLESQQSIEMEGSPIPVKGVLTLEAMNGNIQVIKSEVQSNDGIQSRPLPAPPAPVRYGRVKEADRTIVEESQNFQTCRDTLATQSRTLIVSDEDDNTMADSIVESLVSCTDTLLCDDDHDFDDDPYPSVNFEGGLSELLEVDTKPVKRLEEGTQKLSLELMEHVESLRTTLDNMSSRLGARSRSRSSSRSRPASLYRQEK